MPQQACVAACGAGVHGMGSVRAYGELRTALRGAPATAAAAAAAAGSCIAASAASAAPWPTITHTAILAEQPFQCSKVDFYHGSTCHH